VRGESQRIFTTDANAESARDTIFQINRVSAVISQSVIISMGTVRHVDRQSENNGAKEIVRAL
jgi:hypothetical protein